MQSNGSDQPRVRGKIENLAQIKQIIEDDTALLTNTVCPWPPKDRSLSSILSQLEKSKSRKRVKKKKTFSRSAGTEFCCVLSVIAIIIAIIFRWFFIKNFNNLNYV